MVLDNSTLVNYYFEKICSIPHTSFNEKALSDYVVSVAKKYGHEVTQDELGNVIVFVKASKDYENIAPIMLQGHLDMVGTRSKDSNFDFLNEPINLVLKDNILTALDTTLGADDGVAISYMLALITDKNRKHPPLECVFTVQEETGCDGASYLDISKTKAKTLINLDSGDQEIVTVGSYCSDKIELSLKSMPIYEKRKAYKCHFYSFDAYSFNNGLLNKKDHAIKYLFEIFNETINDYSIVELMAGSAENKSPVDIILTLIVKEEELNKAIQIIKDDGHQVDIEEIETNYYLDKETNNKINYLINNIDNGPLQYDDKHNMLSSFNFGKLIINEKEVRLIGSSRCKDEKINKELKDKIKKQFSVYDYMFKNSIRYISWPYQKDSQIKKLLEKEITKYWHVKMQEKLCPGGLEITDFLNKREFDAISFGPLSGNYHEVGEWLDIVSFNKTYELLCHLLEDYK